MMSNRLPALAAAIRSQHLEVTAHHKAAAEKMLAVGAALAEAKTLCAHGAWGAFLKEASISERSAQRYMRLHRAGFIPTIVADFGVAQADQWASFGLRLWPDGDTGREFCGINQDGTKIYGLCLPNGGGRGLYVAIYLSPDGANDFWTVKECSLPLTMGILHDHVSAAFDHYQERGMDAEETRRAAAQWPVAS